MAQNISVASRFVPYINFVRKNNLIIYYDSPKNLSLNTHF